MTVEKMLLHVAFWNVLGLNQRQQIRVTLRIVGVSSLKNCHFTRNETVTPLHFSVFVEISIPHGLRIKEPP